MGQSQFQGWCIVWSGNDSIPKMTSNVADYDLALQMARSMTAERKLVWGICSANELHSLLAKLRSTKGPDK